MPIEFVSNNSFSGTSCLDEGAWQGGAVEAQADDEQPDVVPGAAEDGMECIAERTHSGRYCYGKTPLQTFIESATLAYNKQLNQMQPASTKAEEAT